MCAVISKASHFVGILLIPLLDALNRHGLAHLNNFLPLSPILDPAGHLRAVKLLLNLGAKVNRTDKAGQTALYAAAR